MSYNKSSDLSSQIPGAPDFLTRQSSKNLFHCKALTQFSRCQLSGWMGYAFAALLNLFAVFMILTHHIGQGMPVDQLKVLAPPAMNTMEQLLAVQTVVEELIQDGNIILLKGHALLLSILQATEEFAIALFSMALLLVFRLVKYIILLTFLETSMRYLPVRRASMERWMRRLRDWWFSKPAAPVILERVGEDKKKR